MKYEILAEYIVKKDLVVEVEDGADPSDPSNWEDVLDEWDVDTNLYDVIEYKLVKAQGPDETDGNGFIRDESREVKPKNKHE